MINIAIKATYYIFCCKNRNWDSPDLMQFWFLFFLLAFVLFLFLYLLFLFNNPISRSICKLPIRSEIYNCTFKKTNKVSIIIIIIIIVIVTYYYHFISNEGGLNIFFLFCLQYLLFLPKRQLQLQHSHQVEEEQGIALFAKAPWEGTAF